MAGTSPTSGSSSALPITKLINNTTTPSGSTLFRKFERLVDHQSARPDRVPTAANHADVQSGSAQPDGRHPVGRRSSRSSLRCRPATNLETSFSNFQSNFAVLQSAQLIGKTVTVNYHRRQRQFVEHQWYGGRDLQFRTAFRSSRFWMRNGNPITDSNGSPVTFTTIQITGIQ